MTTAHSIPPVENRPIALSDGGPLPTSAALYSNLGEVLIRAAQEPATKGLHYLEADGGETFQSYATILAEAQRILHGLREAGLRPGAKVIFQFPLNKDIVTMFWACVLGGFIPVPLTPPPDYEATSAALGKLEHAWQSLDGPLVVTSAARANAIAAWAARTGFSSFRLDSIERLRSGANDLNPHPAQRDDTALLLLTSGSTGLPKGVVLSHHNLLAFSAGLAQMFRFTPDDVALNWMPLDHVAGLAFFHIQLVFQRAHQVHSPPEFVLQQPLRWVDWMSRYRATIAWAPNFAYGLINDRAAEIAGQKWDLSAMRILLNGGEAVVPKTARTFLKLFIPHGLPPNAMTPGWGMSETCSGLAYSMDRFTLATTSDDDKFVAVGLPLPGCAIRIVDAGDQVVREGEAGRLQVRGACITSGYYQNPELTAESFTADGWFKTGDLGMLKDSQLTITGREKDIIIVNGHNFYSHEIETTVEEVEGVAVTYAAACAIRRPDEDTDQLAIFFSLADETAERPGPKLVRELRARVLQRCAIYPEILVCLPKSGIPKTSTGKIQRAQLRERFEAGDFREQLIEGAATATPTGVRRSAASEEYVAPRSETERQIAAIWESLFEVAPIGVRDNFFELGGRSLLAARMLSRLQKTLGVSLEIEVLFNVSTIEHLAQIVEDLNAACKVWLLQGGTSNATVFLFPPAREDGTLFIDLVKTLGHGPRVFALQAHGLEAEKPDANLKVNTKETATIMAREILQRQPAGPYVLVGHCFGSLLAYATAQHLLAEGHEVALLALVDPLVDDFIPEAYKTAHGAKPTANRGFLGSLFGSASALDKLRSELAPLGRHYAPYHLTPSPVRVTLFLAKSAENDPRSAWWQALAPQGFESITSPSDHRSILHIPAVEKIVTVLRAALPSC